MISYNKRLVIMSILTIVLIFVVFYIGKIERNNQLEALGITSKQAKEIKNDINNLNKKYSSDSITNDEENFFNLNGVKKDTKGLYYIYDKYQGDSKMIYFKKDNGVWKWSILLGDWDDLNDNKYDNPKSIYNGYIIKQDKTKEIFEKLSGKQINNQTSQNTEETKKEIDIINTVKNENTSNNTQNNDKYIYSLFENSDGTYTFLGYGASVNQKEEIKKLAMSKGINGENLKIERAFSSEDIYRKNLELTSKNPTKMKEFLGLLKVGGDDKDWDDSFKSIYKYNVSKENLEKYSEEVNEIKEFGNIELIEK